MIVSVFLISAVGLVICLYGAYVEKNIKADSSYKAMCDISDQASCTKTFLSPWGKLLGVSNIYVGIIFYIAMMVLAFFDQDVLVFLGAGAASIASIYFAYILYAKVKTFCLICVSTYLVNALLLWATYKPDIFYT